MFGQHRASYFDFNDILIQLNQFVVIHTGPFFTPILFPFIYHWFHSLNFKF